MTLFRERFRKSICLLVAFVFGWTQTTVSFAGANTIAEQTQSVISDYGKQASAFGKELSSQAGKAAPTFDGTTIRFKASGETIELSKDSLAPSDGDNIRYLHQPEDFDAQTALYNDSEKMDELGGQQKDALFADSTSDNPTIEGQVYSILVDMARKDKPSYTQAHFLEKTQEILSDMDNVLKDLVSCDATSALDRQDKHIHVEDRKECQQVIDRSTTCKITHDYAAGIIEHADGPFNLKACDDMKACTWLWIGKVGDNYWSGKCSVYEQWTQVRVRNPQAILRATFEYAKWDDYMMVYVGKPGQEELIWTGPYDWSTNRNYFPPETPGKCELRTSWERNPGVDVTRFFRNAQDGQFVNFKIRTSVSGKGEGYGRIRIQYDPTKLVSNDLWKPKACFEVADGVQDGMASGEIKCTKMPQMDTQGCAWIDGAQVCADKLSDSPLSGVSRFCREVTVRSTFFFNKGDTGCWKALAGFDDKGQAIYETVCGGENVGGNLDTCQKYKDNAQCQFVSSTCTPGMMGKSGTCYVNDVVYDCGRDVKVATVTADTKYDCKGVACLGEQCIDVERTHGTNFAKVNALMNAHAVHGAGYDVSRAR